MIGSVEDMEEACRYKSRDSLVPTRTEPHKTEIAIKCESADSTSRRKEPNHRGHPQSQSRETGLDGKVRRIGIDRVLEKHVEQTLVPIQDRKSTRLNSS